MANPNWKKGVSGNPNGRPPVLPADVVAERKRNQIGLIKLISVYVNITQEEALKRMNGEKCSQIEEMIQGMIMKAKEGDVNCFKFLTEVMAGKIADPSVENEFSHEDIEILAKVKELKEAKKIGSNIKSD